MSCPIHLQMESLAATKTPNAPLNNTKAGHWGWRKKRRPPSRPSPVDLFCRLELPPPPSSYTLLSVGRTTTGVVRAHWKEGGKGGGELKAERGAAIDRFVNCPPQGGGESMNYELLFFSATVGKTFFMLLWWRVYIAGS